MTDTIAEVFRFENYVGRHFPDYILTKETESGDYVSIKTQKLYWLWKAAQNQGGDGHASDPRAAEILGRVIHDAGVELGTVREQTELSGPQLLMILDDIKELAQRQNEKTSDVWQFYQDGEWRVGVNCNNHRENTEAAGLPTRDLVPATQTNWVPCSDRLPTETVPVLGYNAEWVDGDFNPKGIRECVLYGDGTQWMTARWCDTHDCWVTTYDHEAIPTHWMEYPEPPEHSTND